MAFRFGELHINPVDGLHGGALATFADAMIAAVHDGAEAGAAHTPTISLSVEYFAPVPEGALVEAEVDLVRKTASMIFRSEEHTSELQSLMRSSYAVFCLKKKITINQSPTNLTYIHQL